MGGERRRREEVSRSSGDADAGLLPETFRLTLDAVARVLGLGLPALAIEGERMVRAQDRLRKAMPAQR